MIAASKPEVSVLTPSFGYARFIGDALASVQCLADVGAEHVVQDGGSTDGTIEVLRRYPAARWESAPDRGQSDALNRALARARGRWIAWLNADEFYLPGGLAHLVAVGERTGADLVYGDCVFVDEEGRLLRLLPGHPFSQGVLRCYGPFIASCAMVVRREALGGEPWDPAVGRIMDWDLYLSLDRAGRRFVWTPFPVGCFRVHAARITATPASLDHPSYRRVFRRHGLELSAPRRLAGRAGHVVLKLASGGYWRQVRARALRGADLRWFANPQAAENVRRLLARCYPLVARGQGPFP